MYRKLNKVFVYGTLMKGHGNNRLLPEDSFVLSGKTTNRYHMTANGIPFVSQKTPTSFIKGELYFVTDEELEQLDRLEGHPNWYKRELVLVDVDHFITHAWLYFNEHDRGGYVISDGDYNNFSENVKVL